MTGQQSLVAAGGVGLILANMWTGPQRAELGAIFGGAGTNVDPHKALVQVAGEVLFVLVAVILAGLGDGWGTAMSVAIVGLFVLWAINHYGSGTQHRATTTTIGGAAA